jgi:hypothetical protein
MLCSIDILRKPFLRKVLVVASALKDKEKCCSFFLPVDAKLRFALSTGLRKPFLRKGLVVASVPVLKKQGHNSFLTLDTSLQLLINRLREPFLRKGPVFIFSYT